MRSVVVIPTVLATLRICAVNEGIPTCEAGVGDDFLQCGETATFTRQDDGDKEPWPVCALHRVVPGTLL